MADVSYPILDKYEDIYIRQYDNFYTIEKINENVGITLYIGLDLHTTKDRFKEECLTLYAKEFLQEFERGFKEYNVNYYPRISFITNASNIQMYLAIDSSNDCTKKQINFLTRDDFNNAITNKDSGILNLLTGDLYTASIVKSNRDSWKIDEVKKDFAEICNFNYLEDKIENDNDKEADKIFEEEENVL